MTSILKTDEIQSQNGGAVVKMQTLKHPSSASNNLVLGSDGNVSITNEITSGTFNGTLGTNVTGLSASQDLTNPVSNSIDFTGIPSGVKYIIINCYGVSMADPSGTDLLIQIGDSGGIETSSYITSSAIIGSTTANVTNTGGFIVGLGSSGRVFYGHIHLTNVDTNKWLSTHSGSLTTTIAVTGGGQHSLSDTLTQIRVKSASGANFDSGIVSIIYYT
jgi:hypothetical protein